MPGLRKLFAKDVAFQCKDWKGRDVFCDVNTVKNHVARLHPDAALAVDRIKLVFPSPDYVVECRSAKSENAIYAVAIGDHPWVVVAIKTVWVMRSKMRPAQVRLISTWHDFPEEELQTQLTKGRIILRKS